MSFKTGFNALIAAAIFYMIINDAELAAKVATLTMWETVSLFTFAVVLTDAAASGLKDLKKP
jgi:hypothetical protein